MEPKALAPHPGRADAASRVKAWTRGRFGDVTVLVTELQSAVPGFPPLRTVVAFWSAERKHFHFSVFKPLERVEESDLPPAWYRDALAVTPGIDCSCC
jgi:nitrate reductase delta subunit